MGETVRVSGDYYFPPNCVVCQRPPTGTYTIEKNIYTGTRANLMLIPVPMCAEHLAIACRAGEGEKRVERIGRGLGSAAGLAVAAALELHWIDQHAGNPFLNLFLALFFGASIGLILWVIHKFYLAPFFADASTRAVRDAVKIQHYASSIDELTLTFSHPAAAQAFKDANQAAAGQ